MDEEKLERRERDFWERERGARGRESGGAGRHKKDAEKVVFYNDEYCFQLSFYYKLNTLRKWDKI